MAVACWKIVRAATGAAVVASPTLFSGVLLAQTAPLECFSTAETRQKITSHKLADPFGTMQAVGSGHHGEPIGAKLCRRGDDFVYEISLLRGDGRLVKIYVDAVAGGPLGAPIGR